MIPTGQRIRACYWRLIWGVVTGIVAVAWGSPHAGAANVIDLSKAVIAAPAEPAVFAKYADMIVSEIAKRSGLQLTVSHAIPAGQPSISIACVGTPGGASLPAGLAVPDKPEAYALWTDATAGAPSIHIVGRDFRGALFGVGRLIRLLHYSDGKITVDAALSLASAPKYAIRGHQLGYRNTPNAYDAWDQAKYEQYIRDLALFGTNAIEFTTTLDNEERRGPNMIKSTWDMTADLSKLLDDYDLNCWIWQEIPFQDDVSKPAVADEQLASMKKLFESMKRLDGVFVPGGDGGITPAPILMPYLERLAPVLKASHPKAGVWVSNQTFGRTENDFFFDYLKQKQPAWLEGVIYGPWTRMSPEEMRQRTPEKYPIRNYADITHNVRAQYPLPEWDRAFAHILNREAPNPRPEDLYYIFTKYDPLFGDSLTYSEGVNDDLNKFVWSALGWDPATPLDEILYEYGKVFFGDDEADAVAKGLKMLENNWRGPIASNDGIEKTLAHWKGIEERSAKRPVNWRLQMYLIRAYDDAYTKKKADAEAHYEAEAYDALKQAKPRDAASAIDKARAALAQIDSKPPAPEYRKRIEALAAELFKSIGMQLSVRPPFHASGPERCALLDTLDYPLNDRPWLEKQFKEALAQPSAPETFLRIQTILNWENPGPGGFYDDLGNPQKQPHLLNQHQWKTDPGYVDAPQCEYLFGLDKKTLAPSDYRLSWLDQASTIYKQPLRLHYDGLDSKASYRIRVTYTGRFRSAMRLLANGQITIHTLMAQPKECWPLEFSIPAEATKDGKLDLEWQIDPNSDDQFSHTPLNRGCQVAEIWLLREGNKPVRE